MGASEVRNGKCPACKVEGVKLIEVNSLFICEKCSSKRFSNKVRKSIQEAFERQEEIRRREQWKKRIDVAKKGIKQYDESRVADALRTFREYLSILETRFSVAPGGLHSGLFDKKKEAGEILLVAGIYWDMAKIYDHMKGKQPELRQCLNKFIEFSVNRPHVILSSEALRRYLASKKAINEVDFKAAQSVLHSHLTKCFIATAVFGPRSEEVAAFQAFRDEVLAVSLAGRAFIRAYYLVSPTVMAAILRSPKLASLLRAPLRAIYRAIAIE